MRGDDGDEGSDSASDSDEDDNDGDDEKVDGNISGSGKAKSGADYESRKLRAYMRQLDRELGSTKVMQGFERFAPNVTTKPSAASVPSSTSATASAKVPASSSASKQPAASHPTAAATSAAAASSTSSTSAAAAAAPSAASSSSASASADQEAAADDGDDLAPINLNLNLVKNLLDSYEAQHGEAGPVSNLLGSLGIRLPSASSSAAASKASK
jgi:hypothetical protein